MAAAWAGTLALPDQADRLVGEARRHVELRTGEASLYYLFHPLVPQRVAEHLPQVKLIALLRDPVGRAYSHYQHEVARGFETPSFEE